MPVSLVPFLLFSFFFSSLLPFSLITHVLPRLVCTFVTTVLLNLSPYSSKVRKNTLSPNTLVWQGTIAALTLERRNFLQYRSRSLILQTNACFSPALAEAGPMGKSYPAVGNCCAGVSGLSWSGSACKFFVKSAVRRKRQTVRSRQMGTAKSKQQQNHQIAAHMLHASSEDAWIGLILSAQQHKVITNPGSKIRLY